MTASASRSCGTAFGCTKEVTSIRFTPASDSRSTTSIFSSVGMKSGSIWNPSRVPTSQIVTRSGNFIVVSPVGRVSERPRPCQNQRAPCRPSYHKSCSGAPMSRRILIADDDEASRQGLKALLSAWGYEVEVAADGEEALARATTFLPDVVVTDLAMPKLAG